MLNHKKMEEALKESLKRIPKRLKAARKARGFKTRRSFALACDVPPPTYLNHEEGKSELRVSHLMLYSTILDVSVMWLLLGVGNPLDHYADPELSEAKLFKAYISLAEMESR